ncbi:MAG: DivIVA domain-containing protein, partial [Nesterenkonia sp.]|nr:DivIVA domain-containing protein [Nesterenkonia sp.]
MALTPEDVKFKEFPETKFRPGYDKDEVDDFLDEIFDEWTRLIAENKELKDQVGRLEQQIEDDPRNVEPAELDDAGLSGYAGSSAEVTGFDEEHESDVVAADVSDEDSAHDLGPETDAL